MRYAFLFPLSKAGQGLAPRGQRIFWFGGRPLAYASQDPCSWWKNWIVGRRQGLEASPEQLPGLFPKAASLREHGDRYLSVRCRREEAPPTCSTLDWLWFSSGRIWEATVSVEKTPAMPPTLWKTSACQWQISHRAMSLSPWGSRPTIPPTLPWEPPGVLSVKETEETSCQDLRSISSPTLAGQA